ncbi:MAG: CoA-binding protein [Candidatus Bathyarchaeia archaeon]
MVSEILKVLSHKPLVAIVGLSRNPEKYSYKVAMYLKENGFKIIPVNPNVKEVLNEKSYESLLKIPLELQKKIEIINVFRPPETVLDVAKEAVKLKEKNENLKIFWMQPGAVNDEAKNLAEKAGFKVVAGACIMAVHKKFKDKLKTDLSEK